jgi:calcineurin-like phosphoesterase family protein
VGKAWLWSDPHFGHKNILKFEGDARPFLDTEHMDNVIIENYNNIVEDGDMVFWLGDMFFCGSERRNYITSRLKLDGKRNFWIRGNHDSETNNKIRTLGFMPCKMYYFNSMMLTHQPMTPDNIKYMRAMHPMFIGNVHGHTHSSNTKLDPSRWQCVSMEKVDFKPILWSDLAKRFKDGEAVSKWFDETNGDLEYFKTGDHLRRR